MEDYQEDYLDCDYDVETDELSDEEKEERAAHPCGCGSFCMNCLGMSWRDFI